MKILFIVSILLLTCIHTVYSGNFGVQAGARLNTSGITYPGVEVNRKIGFEGGAFYRQNIVPKMLNVRVAMLYFNQEFSLKNNQGNNTGITYHFAEHNLKLPLTVEWHPLPGLIKPFLTAGVYTSYSLSGNIKDQEADNTLKYKKDGDRMDYGAVVGLGVYFTSSIALNANYQHGFTDRSMVLGNQFVSVKNRGFSVALHYLF